MPDTQIVTDSKNNGEVSCMGGYEGKVSPYPAMTETRERDGKALSHSGKRQIQEDCIRQCRRRGMLLRANAEKRYPAWEDTKACIRP